MRDEILKMPGDTPEWGWVVTDQQNSRPAVGVNPLPT
jgi:hypothetical protein